MIQVPTVLNKFVGRLLPCSLAVVLMIGATPHRALAQDTHSHTDSAPTTSDQQANASALIRLVRQATAQFQDVNAAMAAGYNLGFGCVTGPDKGAMGLHYINQQILGTNQVDPMHPQIVIYEPQSDGKVKLTGADYLVFAEQWNKDHHDANGTPIPPQLMGQLFQYFESPNRFGLPAFYTLHVWAWKENPNGAFVNWHPHVSCESFVAPQQ